jgi:UDP-2,3-diacylglucosamine pyrophosphatase LpxH
MTENANTTRIIISDLHLGKNDDFDIFKAPGKQEAFEAFLDFCNGGSDPVELVINGDFVDFLQLRPWNVYGDRAQALEKAEQIVSGNARVFTALGKFIQDREKENKIVVLLGNHDTELAYDEVWAVVRDAIATTSAMRERLNFINRKTQYNFRLNGVLTHVEHGNIGDPWNEILYNDLFNDAEKNTGFNYPPGTLLVYQVMNEFKERLRFVDLLKPEVPAVPLILAKLEPFAVAAQFPSTAVNIIKMVKAGFLARIRQAVGGGTFAPITATEAPGEPYVRMADEYIDKATKGKPASFKELDADHLEDFLDHSGFQLTGPATATFGPRWSVIMAAFGDAILGAIGRPARMNDREFYKSDRAGHDVDLAQTKLKGDVRLVISGHTHAALKADFGPKGLYLNSGTWANLIELPSDSSKFGGWLQSIARNTFERSSFPTYITASPAQNGIDASLNLWSDKGEERLWSRNIQASR